MSLVDIIVAILIMAWRCSASTHAGLVNRLKQAGIITSDRVLQAMFHVDRMNFAVDKSEAYMDRPHSIGFAATISAPHMHAMCLEQLENYLHEGANVLDVGCGCGYLTVCMATMVGENGKVYGIDHIPELVQLSIDNTAKEHQHLLNKNVFYQVEDGFKGLPEHGPFDAIHVGAAAPSLPMALVHQLKPLGAMVIPIGTFSQELVLVIKDKEGEGYTARTITGVTYVPLTTRQKQLSRLY